MRRARWLIVSLFTVIAFPVTSAAARPSHTLRPAQVRLYGSSVTRGHITRGHTTVSTTFLVPGLPHIPVVHEADSTLNCSVDTSGSVKACMTEYFNNCTFGSAHAIELGDYTYSWTNLDPGSELVQLTSGTVRAEMTGITVANHCGGPTHTYPVTVRSKSVSPAFGFRYTFTPSFGGYNGAYVAMTGPGSSCGNTRMGIKRRTEKWTVSVPNVCEGASFF